MGRDDDKWSAGYHGTGSGDPSSKEYAMGREWRQHQDQTMASIRAREAGLSQTGPSEPGSYTIAIFGFLAFALCVQVCLALGAMGLPLWVVFGGPGLMLIGFVRLSQKPRFKRYAKPVLIAVILAFFFIPGLRDPILTSVAWLNPFK